MCNMCVCSLWSRGGEVSFLVVVVLRLFPSEMDGVWERISGRQGVKKCSTCVDGVERVEGARRVQRRA